MVIILSWIKELLTFLLFFLAIALMLSMAQLLQTAGAEGAIADVAFQVEAPIHLIKPQVAFIAG